ncbi:MAG: hypothetical protein RDV48_30130 [Candidatus Eremiobacteraeota bacterium]|nr:hypothetical protein [Candidatus Eremiobacteraeota bacterium]
MDSIGRKDLWNERPGASHGKEGAIPHGTASGCGLPGDAVSIGGQSSLSRVPDYGRIVAAGAAASRPTLNYLQMTQESLLSTLLPVALSDIPGLDERVSTLGEPYRFAPRYSIDEVMNNAEKAEAFTKDYLMAEAPYFAIARDPESGLSFDGIKLDMKTGKPLEVRNWSAPSKECLDIGLCIKALAGDPKVSLVVSKDDPSKAPELAADILRKKMDSYEKFNKENPGYGGFVPWFKSGKDMTPTPDWESQVPGLDNGEWIWTLLDAEQALRDKGMTDLADRYGRYNDLLRSNVVKMFYDPDKGLVRGDIKVVDPKSADSAYELAPGKCNYLDGIHEGHMLLLYVALFGKGLPEGAEQKIWDSYKLKKVDTKWGTTWQAWAGSSHESWAHLFLPTRDLEPFKKLFRIREEIRSQNAAERHYPGFASSTNEPGGNGYYSACGIEGIGTLEPEHNNVFAIYGVFPMLQEFSDREQVTGNYGLAWLLNMLKCQKMQGPLGGGESATNDGKLISPMKTIDGSFPNILAMSGGLAKETAAMLERHGLYDRFMGIEEKKLKEAFG